MTKYSFGNERLVKSSRHKSRQTVGIGFKSGFKKSYPDISPDRRSGYWERFDLWNEPIGKRASSRILCDSYVTDGLVFWEKGIKNSVFLCEGYVTEPGKGLFDEAENRRYCYGKSSTKSPVFLCEAYVTSTLKIRETDSNSKIFYVCPM